MRVDASQVLAQGGIKTKQGTDAAVDLVKNAGIGGLADAAGANAEEDLSPVKPGLMRGFSDMSLAPYAAKLSELNIPVTEETARTMRDLMSSYPRLSMDEAAFLASNKITGDESLMNSALDVLSGGDKTSAMIAKIISTLNIEIKQDFHVNQDLGTRDPENNAGRLAEAGDFRVEGSGRGPLSELIAAIVKSAPELLAGDGVKSVPIQGVQSESQIVEQIIPQPDNNMQPNTEKNNIFLQNLSPETAANATDVTKAAAGLQEQSQSVTFNAQAPAENIAGENAQIIPKEGQETIQGQDVKQGEGRVSSEVKTVQAAVAQLLSDVPGFQGTPQTALDRFSGMLLRVAKDTGGDQANAGMKDVEALAAQLDKLFTKIDRKDPNAGTRLRQAREELFARLTLVQEEIAKASQPAREQLLMQTQKLMDHVKLLNNIEQFAYMQLPVQMGEDRNTAELYVFKRKGGKRADPDNVNILLAIDLEHMGHWEALLNIKGKDVYLNMEVAGEAEKEHFGNNTVLLHELLAEEGFKLVNTNIRISQEETTPLTALSALDRYTGKQLGKIDFKI